MTTTAAPGSAGLALAAARGTAGSVGADAVTADTVTDLLRALGEVEKMVRATTAWRTELLDAVRHAVELAPDAMLAPELAPDAWMSPDDADLTRRALVAEVATTLGLHERTAARLLDEAELLTNGLPATVTAMRAGAASYRHAQALVEHTSDLDESDRRAVEAATLPNAGTMPPGAFSRHVARAREGLLAEPVTVRHERAASHRRVWVEPARDGMAFLTAHLPAVTACAVADRLDHAARVLAGPDEPRTTDQLRADVLSVLLLDDGTLDRGVLAHAGTLEESTPAGQRTGRRVVADQHVVAGRQDVGLDEDVAAATARELAARLWSLPFDADDTPERLAAARAVTAQVARLISPRVYVTVPALAMLETIGTEVGAEAPRHAAPGSGSAPPGSCTQRRDLHHLPSRDPARLDPTYADPAHLDPAHLDPAHLDGYGPIDEHTATLLAARAPSFRRLLTHPHTGAVLAVGRDSYAVPADLRAFLRLRDGTCRFPGCTRRTEACDVDHTVAYVAGGTTSAGNLAHLCRAHHRLKHGTRWDVRQVGADGTLIWTSPTGREHVTRPELTLSGASARRPEDGRPPPF